jgi:uncharacterized Zn-finger protein
MKENNLEKVVSIAPTELPLHCPTQSQESWNLHPKVFLPLDEKQQAKCPYCGTEYQLQD